ncbi:hypothetical protein EVAR_70422_1 [Eumeta japonica]|uniref:Uncharacterized protein n=1 Tax=Eumeta variegata TaxID=151549 RepID=A0A4C2A4G8_EUMVA|nr:hypothetical protein EVAR_70422_1 [Eumeta japonica]
MWRRVAMRKRLYDSLLPVDGAVYDSMLHICQASRDGSFFPYAPSIGMRFTPVHITLIQINSMKIHTKKIKLLLLRCTYIRCRERCSVRRSRLRTDERQGLIGTAVVSWTSTWDDTDPSATEMRTRSTSKTTLLQ